MQIAEGRAPNSAADPRPNSKPYYIEDSCPLCGHGLMLADIWYHPDLDFDEVWHDEWICSNCKNGIYYDIPLSALKHIFALDDVEPQPRSNGKTNTYYERQH